MVKRIVVLAAVLVMLGAGPALAQQYPPSDNGMVPSTPTTVVVDDAAGVPAGPKGSLPRTGADSSLPLAQMGLGLVAAGGVVTAVAARRRKLAG